MTPYYSHGGIDIYVGDCREVIPQLEESFDACVTDPPYHLTTGKKGGSGPASVNLESPYGRARIGTGFMGKAWDGGDVAFRPETWAAIAGVLKPGAHVMAFGGTRTFHRLACAIEDAGFEIRDMLMWLYGCLSDDTDILVDGQWEPYHKAAKGSLALCYDLPTDEFSWQPIQERFEYRIDDTAYRISSDFTDQIVSRNHRCIVEQDGASVFCFAEKAARQREIRVPVLEDLQGMLNALPVPHAGTGAAKQHLFNGLRACSAVETASPQANDSALHGTSEVCGLSKEVLDCTLTPENYGESDLLSELQRSSSRARMEAARSQGTRGVDAGSGAVCIAKDDRPQQSSMEGRRDLLSKTRQLQADQVCPLSAGVPDDGTQGRLRDGASPDRGSSYWTSADSDGNGSSRYARPAEQQPGNIDAVSKQSGAQTVRASRYTRSDLARIEPIHYSGVVWCVRVPTGAFVARRNGKVFITGNSGFPKSLNLSKALDKHAGAERDVIGVAKGAATSKTNSLGIFRQEYAATLWDGYGTALKPAWEPVILGMKPCDGTFAENALEHGVAGLNVDESRIRIEQDTARPSGINKTIYGEDNRHGMMRGGKRMREGEASADRRYTENGETNFAATPGPRGGDLAGRWPANLILDEEAATLLDDQSGDRSSTRANGNPNNPVHQDIPSQLMSWGGIRETNDYRDSGGASRFFYTAKADSTERGTGNNHPTVKPLDLMRYLCKLLAPPSGGLFLEPFAGSGTTLIACKALNIRAVGIELSEEYAEIAAKRLSQDVLEFL